jgi:putative membrane protein
LPVASRSCSAFVTGLARLWRSAGYGRGIRPIESVAFGAGWLTLVVALSPPLDEWSDQWLAAHMVQHELLMMVAAPLIALGGPMVATLWAMPSVMRRRTVEVVRRTPLTAAWTIVTSPASVFFLYAIALWVWL